MVLLLEAQVGAQLLEGHPEPLELLYLLGLHLGCAALLPIDHLTEGSDVVIEDVGHITNIPSPGAASTSHAGCGEHSQW